MTNRLFSAASCRALATLLSLLLTGARAEAMDEKQASGNLMYFAFAVKQGEACQRLGFTEMSALRGWEKRNGDVLVRSLRRIEEYAAATRKLTQEEATDVALGLFIRQKEKFDQEMAPTLGKASCLRFGETLRLYETKLVQ